MDSMCLDFINSEFRDFRGRWVRDDLQRPGWLEQFFDWWGLRVERHADAATLTSFVALRTLLRLMIESLPATQVAGHDLAALNAVMYRTPLSRKLVRDEHGYRLEMLPLRRDWDWAQAEVAASFAHLLASRDPRRLKVCANSNCRWVFYDESKSRTRRYCAPDKCANLLKARRYRARRKNSRAAGPPA
jgi:predicted RNA-binding Zn ribbon-like protein